ncbi:MCE family protein [Aeromicrobium sp. CTD01-1L150]|uniref:MCE family protein n=1 Tax=Aeromicrobium sp. CTD01-1L150 TaxID=3341830 RepID=UPI0035C03B7C
MRRTRTSLTALATAAALTLGGCGMLSGGVYDTPLPGGADVGKDPITVSADFEDVLDLVPQSSVKADNVDVGRVSKIILNDDGRSAQVEIVVRRDVEMPAGTTARLQQTSLLGEKYVAIVRPDEPQAGPAIGDGDALGLEETSQAAQVEQVLGALSLVLNGGGIGQFQEISRELQDVSTGRPEEIKAFLTEMEGFVSVLDERKESITDAIDGLADLSRTLEADQDKIVSALDGLSPGMQVLVDQREQLVDMLKALDRLSAVSVQTLDAAQDDIVADLKLLQPILDRLAASGRALPESLEILLTYPFPDSVLGAIKGDYLNVFIETNFRTPSGCGAIGCDWPQITGNDAPASGTGAGRQSQQAEDETPPTLLPPTTSPSPGTPGPSVTVPTPGPGVPPTLPGGGSPPPTAPSTSAPTSTLPPEEGDE